MLSLKVVVLGTLRWTNGRAAESDMIVAWISRDLVARALKLMDRKSKIGSALGFASSILAAGTEARASFFLAGLTKLDLSASEPHLHLIDPLDDQR